MICITGGQDKVTESCPPGYYCPTRTKFEEEFPCPEKTYNPDRGKSNDSACLNCTQGALAAFFKKKKTSKSNFIVCVYKICVTAHVFDFYITAEVLCRFDVLCTCIVLQTVYCFITSMFIIYFRFSAVVHLNYWYSILKQEKLKL